MSLPVGLEGERLDGQTWRKQEAWGGLRFGELDLVVLYRG
jgi:hypothetical protein